MKASGLTISPMAKARGPLKMETCTRDNSRTVLELASENTSGLMVIHTEDNTMVTNYMAKEYIHRRLEVNMLAIFLMTNFMATVSTLGLTVELSTVNLLTEKGTVIACNFSPMEMSTLASK